MKRTFALLALLTAVLFSSCNPPIDIIWSGDQHTDAEPEEIIIPPLTDIGRTPVAFCEIEYSRPDSAELIGGLERARDGVESSSLSYDSLLTMIEEADGMYTEFSTMLSLILLKSSADITDTALAEEYELLSGQSPSIARAVEELFVAIANSEFVKRLEDEEFGEGFFDEYKDGSKYTDTVVALLERESKLEADYLAISASTVMINYDGVTDSYENTVIRISEKYREGSARYIYALAECEELYYEEAGRLGEEIFIELLKVRAQIAEAYGYENYAEYSYEALGHDYTAEEMDALLSDIAEYTVPVYASLCELVFSGYFKSHAAPLLGRGRVVNTVYSALSALDDDIGASFSYMLNCGLYDIDSSSDKRRDSSFTIHLDDSDTPFIFATLYNTPDDYMTLTHEFGHFYDNLINGGMGSSLDTVEVSSQALELLALTEMKSILSAKEYQYLYFSKIESILEVLIFQGFYAKLESLVYDLSYDEISAESVNRLVKEAAAAMKLNPDYFDGVADILIIHLIDTPFYVQSYCTSLIASLDIYFAECENEGRGVALYKAVIAADKNDGFTENLTEAGVPSPFRENALTELLDKIYFSILGSHYYGGSPDIVNAA